MIQIITTEEGIQEVIDKALEKAMRNYQKNEVDNPYNNLEEAAEFIKKSKAALRQIVYRGEIRHIKKGNSLTFRKTDLIEWLEGGSRKSKAELKETAEDCIKTRKRGVSI